MTGSQDSPETISISISILLPDPFISFSDSPELAEWVDDEGIFTRWDLDADSELDAEEISQSVFTLWDLDNDGLIDAVEYEEGLTYWTG